jgi:hypothetical protein
MHRLAILAAPALIVLAACGDGGAETASLSTAAEASSLATATPDPAPSDTASDSAPEPMPSGPLFVDLVDQSLTSYSGLIGTRISSADLASALPRFDGDVPLPAGTIIGAGRIVERWGESLDTVQVIGVDTAPGKEGLEEYGERAPQGWTYNSVSTTDSSSTLVMTRESDGLRLVYMSSVNPEAGAPPAEFRLQANAAEIPQPMWLAALPVAPGGELTSVGEAVGKVEINYSPAVRGLVTASWRYPAEQIRALQDFYAGGVLAANGFTLVDPDSISVGASYFDVTAGEWQGQIIVGELMDGDQSFASVQWFLTRS